MEGFTNNTLPNSFELKDNSSNSIQIFISWKLNPRDPKLLDIAFEKSKEYEKIEMKTLQLGNLYSIECKVAIFGTQIW